jgi:hypothetical protein
MAVAAVVLRREPFRRWPLSLMGGSSSLAPAEPTPGRQSHVTSARETSPCRWGPTFRCQVIEASSDRQVTVYNQSPVLRGKFDVLWADDPAEDTTYNGADLTLNKRLSNRSPSWEASP